MLTWAIILLGVGAICSGINGLRLQRRVHQLEARLANLETRTPC